MNISTPFSKKFVSLLFAGVMAVPGLVYGQSFKIDATDPKFDSLDSPEFGGNTGRKKFKPKSWLEMEVKLNVSAPESIAKDGYVDGVTIKWYVAAKDPAQKGKGYILLEKQVEYLNIPVGEDIYASVYLSPGAVERLSGSKRASKSVIEVVGGEILFQGRLITRFTSKSMGSKSDWWNSGNLSRMDGIPLRNKNETPFKALWWDRYAEIKDEK
ncbi:Amuc_1102 family pilus-like protein [Persicirhabdus sediminis]|uniref:Uncharacterized protein n=1 Tax=Persicirhabdus sediminis TaxID=454144 RepID=A0A8J7MBW5_9BACT|nr:Amuc_1102 family pilus-like protein [Persicirhabdus sediminis]MBK1789748.1 hypothetical protein [Persicirhabdus sediminis]